MIYNKMSRSSIIPDTSCNPTNLQCLDSVTCAYPDCDDPKTFYNNDKKAKAGKALPVTGNVKKNQLDYNISLYDLKILQDDISQLFSINRMNIARKPICIGSVDDQLRGLFNSYHPNVLDMLVKRPGKITKVHPGCTADVVDVLNKCISFERSINPNFDDKYYVYLTVNSCFIQPGKAQRNPGAHTDGYQGKRYSGANALPSCGAYIVSNTIPTKFWTHPFDCSDYTNKKKNFFNHIQGKLNEDFISYSEPYHIYRMSAYQVHASMPAWHSSVRTFLRIDITQKVFDRDINTVNPNNPPFWIPVDRSMRTVLNEKESKMQAKSHGFVDPRRRGKKDKQ